MKNTEIARELARESGVSPAEAADRLDRVVGEILAQLRKAGEAPLPGLGKFRRGAGGKTTFQRERGERRV
jgi:nucleoid DNA-binding protein